MIGIAVQRTMGFRIDEEHEVSGIDLVIHAESAYDLHSTASTGARAPRPRRRSSTTTD